MGRRQDPGGAARAATVEPTGIDQVKTETAKVRTAKAGFSDLVLVCRKCAKRQGVDRKQIVRAVKRAFEQVPRGKDAGKKEVGKSAKVRVLETGCLGPCPKRMLTLATPESLARRRLLLVDPALEAFGPEMLASARMSAPMSALLPASLHALLPSPLPSPVAVPAAANAASPDVPAEGAGNG